MKIFKDVIEINLRFGELEFKGLRLNHTYEDFPWDSEKEMGEYMDALVKEGSEESSLKYKQMFGKLQKMSIHVKLSYSATSKIISYILFGFGFIFGVYGFPIAGLSSIGISMIFFMLFNYFEGRAKDLYAGLTSGLGLIDLVFANEKREKE